jgi:hypothetical protein
VAGFELATEDEGWEGEFLFWEAERGAKEDLGWPAPGQGHEAHTFFEVAIAGQQFQSCLDEGLRIQGDQVGLVLVDALVVSGIDSAGFLWIEQRRRRLSRTGAEQPEKSRHRRRQGRGRGISCGQGTRVWYRRARLPGPVVPARRPGARRFVPIAGFQSAPALLLG